MNESKPKIKNSSCATYYMLHATRSKGFTLIELLIYTSILVVVLAFTGEYLYSIGQARLNNTARIEVTQGAQFVIGKLKNDISESESIVSPIDSNPSIYLMLSLPEDHSVAYNTIGNQIQRSYDSESFSITSNQIQVSNLSFQKIANDGGKETIQVKFTLTSVAQLSGGRNVSEDFQTTISRR